MAQWWQPSDGGTEAQWYSGMAQWQSGTEGSLWHSGSSHQGSIRSQPGLRQCIDADLEPDLTLQTTLSNTRLPQWSPK